MNNIELMKKAIQELPKVWSVDVQVNQTYYFDHYHQLPPHSIRVIVEGGKKKKIAKVISDYKPLGVLSIGNTPAEVEQGYSGLSYMINFERVGK